MLSIVTFGKQNCCQSNGINNEFLDAAQDRTRDLKTDVITTTPQHHIIELFVNAINNQNSKKKKN